MALTVLNRPEGIKKLLPRLAQWKDKIDPTTMARVIDSAFLPDVKYVEDDARPVSEDEARAEVFFEKVYKPGLLSEEAVYNLLTRLEQEGNRGMSAWVMENPKKIAEFLEQAQNHGSSDNALHRFLVDMIQRKESYRFIVGIILPSSRPLSSHDTRRIAQRFFAYLKIPVIAQFLDAHRREFFEEPFAKNELSKLFIRQVSKGKILPYDYFSIPFLIEALHAHDPDFRCENPEQIVECLKKNSIKLDDIQKGRLIHFLEKRQQGNGAV